MTKRPLTVPSLTIPGRTLVRNERGIPLKCCWDDCDRNGYDENKVVVTDGNKKLHYIFCNDTHKQMHINGHRKYGNKG